MLPSIVEANATTFDLMVTDVYTTWEKHKADPTDGSQYNEDQLMDFMKSVRGQ